MGVRTGYYDRYKREFRTNDIVLNPFCGDLWIVKEYDKDKWEDCKYYLALYGDEEKDYIDLDEPYGFIILNSEEDENYSQLLKELKRIYNKGDDTDGKLETQN